VTCCEYEISHEAREKFLAFLVRMLDNSSPDSKANGLVDGVPAYWLRKPKETEE